MQDPIRAALSRRDRDPCARTGLAESANASDTWAAPFLQPVSNAPADAVKAAWLPVRTGQPVPMLGEEVGYVQPSDCR